MKQNEKNNTIQLKISDGKHFISAMVNDPSKTKGAVRPIKEFDVIEVSKFKLKQITGIKLYHYIVFKEWPKLIKETTDIIGSPKEFTEFREEQTNGESTYDNTV